MTGRRKGQPANRQGWPAHEGAGATVARHTLRGEANGIDTTR